MTNQSTQEKKKIYFETLGCPKNEVDTSYMQGMLNANHTIIETPDAADVIVINTCSFIEAASQESITRILELSEYKKAGTCQKLIVIGCLVERYASDIQKALPEVDIFLGTGAMDQIQTVILPDYFVPSVVTPSPEQSHCFRQQAPRWLSPEIKTAYIRIAEGCSYHCTYCIIPKLRGPYHSISAKRILEEFSLCLDAGIKEIILVAQDTAAYGADLSARLTLSDLLIQMAEIVESSGHRTWIRTLYMNPQNIDEQLVQTIDRFECICPYIDMPIQHVNNDILKKMNRPYQKSDLMQLIEKMRSKNPDIAIRTSLLVGFPGEKEKHFKELMDFIQEIQFDHLGVFDYSDADDLSSHQLKDHINEIEKEERRHALMSCQADISYQRQQRFVGKQLDVLTENLSDDDPPLREGRTIFQAPEIDGITLITGENIVSGEIYPVKITQAFHYDLLGEVL
jgi:ribosomal protein S12 methylthiotransferase